MSTIGKFFDRLDVSLRETNSPNWSFTKICMLVFLYPTLTGGYIYDVIVHERMGIDTSLIFVCAIVAPRAISQALAARFGNTAPGQKADDFETSSKVSSTKIDSRVGNDGTRTDVTRKTTSEVTTVASVPSPDDGNSKPIE